MIETIELLVNLRILKQIISEITKKNLVSHESWPSFNCVLNVTCKRRNRDIKEEDNH